VSHGVAAGMPGNVQQGAVRGGPAAVGFHSGELAVQRQAGVDAQAARLTPMLAHGRLRAGMAAFVSAAPFAAIAARDRAGRLWTSPLLGPPGFLRAATPTTLRVNTSVPNADPLHGLPPGQPVGVIAIDFVTRRRVRINGLLAATDGNGLTIAVDQAYGNCPRYIRRHRIHIDGSPRDNRAQMYHGDTLQPSDIRIVEAADTFFLGTTHAAAGNDASHRGGPPGFVRVAPGQLWWPDYQGNNMFNSLGNLSLDPTAALLFLDFRAGIAVHLSGSATVGWDAPTVISDDTRTGRRVQFVAEQVITTAMPALAETEPAAV